MRRTSIALALLAATLSAQEKRATSKRLGAPTFRNLAYGPAKGQRLDFWRATVKGKRALVLYVHGGGFVGGSKTHFSHTQARALLAAGVSFASVAYRKMPFHPIQTALRDVARAIQFSRAESKKLGIDPSRIAIYGASAGAGASLWCATRDDLADPKSADPVLRQSSRPVAAAMINGQFTYDFERWPTLLGPSPEGQSWQSTFAFYGLRPREIEKAKGVAIRRELDMYGWTSKDDPPVYVLCRGEPDVEPRSLNHYLHHPKHVRLIHRRFAQVGARCVQDIVPDAARGNDLYRSAGRRLVAFLIKELGSAPARERAQDKR